MSCRASDSPHSRSRHHRTPTRVSLLGRPLKRQVKSESVGSTSVAPQRAAPHRAAEQGKAPFNGSPTPLHCLEVVRFTARCFMIRAAGRACSHHSLDSNSLAFS